MFEQWFNGYKKLKQWRTILETTNLDFLNLLFQVLMIIRKSTQMVLAFVQFKNYMTIWINNW